jgi:hypothetical protein
MANRNSQAVGASPAGARGGPGNRTPRRSMRMQWCTKRVASKTVVLHIRQSVVFVRKSIKELIEVPCLKTTSTQ